jgi:cystathionine beta-lyase/cystathionine gamma-synthase
LASHAEHDVATRQMDGYSGMLNFDLVDPSKRDAFIAELKVFVPAVSPGHDESLIFVYHDYAEQHFFRVSIGIEDAADLIADLNQALAKI